MTRSIGLLFAHELVEVSLEQVVVGTHFFEGLFGLVEFGFEVGFHTFFVVQVGLVAFNFAFEAAHGIG
jgi:hypothetical protein